MSEDPYIKWLGLPPGPRPPKPHELLGLPAGIQDREAIDRAAGERMDRLDQYALAGNPATRSQIQQLMNQVAKARTTLVRNLPKPSAEAKPSPVPKPAPAPDTQAVVQSAIPVQPIAPIHSAEHVSNPVPAPALTPAQRAALPPITVLPPAPVPVSTPWQERPLFWPILGSSWAMSLVLTVLVVYLVASPGPNAPDSSASFSSTRTPAPRPDSDNGGDNKAKLSEDPADQTTRPSVEEIRAAQRREQQLAEQRRQEEKQQQKRAEEKRLAEEQKQKLAEEERLAVQRRLAEKQRQQEIEKQARLKLEQEKFLQVEAEVLAEAQAKERDMLLQIEKDIKSDDPRVRSKALAKVLHGRDPLLIPVMKTLLSDPNASYRRRAIVALYLAKAQGMGDQVGAMLADPDASVRHAAAEYGRHLGYKSNLREVKSLLGKKDETSHSAAMHLSQSLPDEEALPILGRFLKHPAHHLRKRAVQALANYDAEQITPYIVDILTLSGDTDTWVRGAVRRDLKKFGPIATKQQLEELAKHRSPEVQAVANDLLEKLEE